MKHPFASSPQNNGPIASTRKNIDDKDFNADQLPVIGTTSGTLVLDIERFVNSSVFDEVYASLHERIVQPQPAPEDTAQEVR
jgi:hypothetical protein